MKDAVEQPPPPPHAVRVGVAARSFTRSLSWEGVEASRLVTHSMPPNPGVAIDAEWFPGAHVTSGVAANFGVYALGELGLGLATTRPGQQSVFPTSSERFRVGALFRAPLSKAAWLDVHGGYSSHTFAIASAAVDGAARPLIPSVAFSGPRAGAGLRLPRLGIFKAELELGGVLLLGLGELGSDAFFPSAGGFGLDAGLAISLKLVDNLEAKLSFDYAHYFLTLNPSRTATVRADAATDLYLGGTLGVVWVM